MNKFLFSLICVSLLSITACTDRALTGENGVETEDNTISQKRKHVNDLGEEHWKVDPKKQIKLYRTFSDRNRNKCNIIHLVADQMSREECDTEKQQQLEADVIPKDYTKDDLKEVFGLDSEPVKGLSRVVIKDPSKPMSESNSVIQWNYTCTQRTLKELKTLIGVDKLCPESR